MFERVDPVKFHPLMYPIDRIRVVSSRAGRDDIVFGPVTVLVARIWWRRWQDEGFEPV
jgi:hypothetical protein